MLNLIPFLINGLTLGLLFALIALGFMLIAGVMEQINLAHGSMFALGAYVALALLGPSIDWPPVLGEWWSGQPIALRYALVLVVAPCIVGLLGIVIELGMRRTYGKDPLFGLLLTFGAAMVIEEAIRSVWGTRDYQLPIPPAISGGFIALNLIWSTYRFYAAAAAMVFILLTWLLIERTRFGAVIKAGAHDSEMVRALGYDLAKLRIAVFVIGTMLAAAAGVIMAPLWGIRPHMGVDAVVPAFLVIVLGGVGSFWGAVIAGLMVGMVVGLTAAYASEWSLLSMYVLLIVVVTFRTRGLFGKKSILEA